MTEEPRDLCSRVDRAILAEEWRAGDPLGAEESVGSLIDRFSSHSVPPGQSARFEGWCVSRLPVRVEK